MSYKDTGLIFAGNVYMAPIVNEVPTDFAGPINVTQLELTPPSPEAIDLSHCLWVLLSRE